MAGTMNVINRMSVNVYALYGLVMLFVAMLMIRSTMIRRPACIEKREYSYGEYLSNSEGIVL